MPVASLQRVSLVPFELGCGTSPAVIESLVDGDPADRLEPCSPDWSVRLLPRGTKTFRSGDHRLVIDPMGFGICLDMHEQSLDGFDSLAAARTIRARRQFHSDICSGKHHIADRCHNLRATASATLHQSEKRSARPMLWESPPYVLSMFFLEVAADLDECLTPEFRRRIAALLEPTRLEERVNGEDAGDHETALAAAIDRYSDIDTVERKRSVDHSVDTLALASWAGLVVVSERDAASRRVQYEGLEIRAQLAWSVAHYLRQWADAVAGGDHDDIVALNKLESKALPRIRNLAHLSTGTTRQAGIFRAISETAGLDREIETAERTLDLAHKAHSHAMTERNHRFNRAIEVLLALVAVSQILPLISDQPMVELPDWIIVIGLGILIVGMVWWQQSRR